jgi:hypothetical protein
MPQLGKMIAAEDCIFISSSCNEAGDDMKNMMRIRIVHVGFSGRENVKWQTSQGAINDALAD